MKNPFPSFPFYAGDYLTDEKVQTMSIEGEGCYIRLLSYCWREYSLPADRVAIAKLCKNHDGPALDEAISCFVLNKKTGRLINKRLERELKKIIAYRKSQQEAGLRGAKTRWGRHRLANRVANDSPMAKNSSSSSSSYKYKNTTFHFDSHHYSWAVWLEESIKQNVPYHKFRGDYLAAWANIFRLMEDQDKVPFDAIDEVLAWCQKDSFWKGNILSAGTFRDKFGRLAAQMKDRPQGEPKPKRDLAAETAALEKRYGGGR